MKSLFILVLITLFGYTLQAEEITACSWYDKKELPICETSYSSGGAWGYENETHCIYKEAPDAKKGCTFLYGEDKTTSPEGDNDKESENAGDVKEEEESDPELLACMWYGRKRLNICEGEQTEEGWGYENGTHCVYPDDAEAKKGCEFIYSDNEEPGDAEEKEEESADSSDSDSSDSGEAVGSCGDFEYKNSYKVSDLSELKDKAESAKAGDLIVLEKGVYQGPLLINGVNGTEQDPVVICGEDRPRIENSSYSDGRIFTVKNSSHIVISSFEITNGMKGLMVEGVSESRFTDLDVHHVGDEGIHLKLHSRKNRVDHNRVSYTGYRVEGFGEGVYIGTSKNSYRNDDSDHNIIEHNTLGPGITAEAIDLKEYTSYGIIRNNEFIGEGMTGANYADSWIDVKGNHYLIKDNTGDFTVKDGFQTHVLVDGWGDYNVFENNTGTLGNSSSSSLLIRISRSTSDAPNNVVKCNNTVTDREEDSVTNLRDCTP